MDMELNDMNDMNTQNGADNAENEAADIQLRPVDAENWKICVDLSVSSAQEEFIAENWYSLLQWKFTDNLYPYCVYAGDTMVGFLMYGLDPETHRWELARLMIDERHQSKGYAKAALSLILDIVREHLGNIAFYVSIDPANETAIKLYEHAGFEKTGEVMWDEDVYKITL